MKRRTPYVGEGADGCRRSAQIDRDEVLGLARDDERALSLLTSAAMWDEQALAHDLAPILEAHYLEGWVSNHGRAIVARCACGHETRPGGHREHLADVLAAWMIGAGL